MKTCLAILKFRKTKSKTHDKEKYRNIKSTATYG